jgi:hypothetical protein
MNTINFCIGGKLGDFIHSLYVVKNLCEQRNVKANLYLSEGGGDTWAFGVQKAYNDLFQIVSKQPYINSFICTDMLDIPNVINLNDWRKEVAQTHMITGNYDKCWSELLSSYYGFEIPKEYKWLEVNEVDENTVGRVIFHRSTHHHTSIGFWKEQIETLGEVPLFCTTSHQEYEQFPLNYYVRPYFLKTVSEWIVAINSCKYFIGNQSAGFAIASSLDKPRLCELYIDCAPFYIDEKKYSNNIKVYPV